MLKKVVVLLLLVLPAMTTAKGKTYGNVTISEVRSIYDGDTFRANIEGWPDIVGKHIGIRVAGVDTPEMRGKCDREIRLARKAKKHAVAMLRAGKKIELKNIQRGKYFRIVGEVIIDGEDLADSLIKAGLGYPYQGGKKQSWCD